MCPSHQASNDRRVLVRLLGDFQVTLGDRTISADDWRLANAAALVKLLALAPDQRLHREQLVELLWPKATPDAGANSLRYALHVARRTLAPDLEPDKHLIRYRAGRLSLRAPAGLWIDAVAFEAAAGTADREATIQAYQRAIELYAGALLPEDRYEDWAIERRDHLQQKYLGLLRNVARLHLERAELDLAIDALKRVVQSDPVDEDAHVHLMRIFASLGLRHQGLIQYHRLHKALAEGIDAEPGPAARRVYRELVSRDGPSADAVRPPQPDTDETSAVRNSNLPASLTSFVGRESEIAELIKIVPAQRLVTLTGPGGAGKTRLALHVADGLSRSFQDGIWLVDLAGTLDPLSVPQQLASALSLRDQPGQSLEETLSLYLLDKRALLIFDNCEHLRGACGRVVYALLQACPDLHVLATSREILHVPGEAVWQVQPLPFPATNRVSASSLRDFDAANLFVERARLVCPELQVTDDTAPAIAEICRRLDGVPLAIELVAARTRTLSLDAIVERLAAPLSLLDSGSRVVPQRHRTLESAIDWSFRLLSDGERALFRRLAVFSGGWTTEAVDQVAAGRNVPESEVMDILNRLVDKSLVAVVSGEDHPRFRLLETIRHYALGQLELAGETAAIRLRHADCFIELVEQGESRFRGPEQPAWLAWWRREQDNVRAALDFLIVHRKRRKSLRLFASLWRFWLAAGQLSEGRRRADRLLETLDPEPTPEYMRVSFGAGRLAYARGDFPEAASRFSDSLELARRLEDQDFVAGSLVQLGHVAVRQGDYPAARSYYEEGLIIRRQQGDSWFLAVVLDGLGQVATAEGDYDTARRHCQESLALYRQSGDPAQIARSLALLGHLDFLSGEYPAAREKLNESLLNAQAADNRQGMALAYAGLGHVAAARGNDRRSSSYFELSRRLYDRIGAQRTIINEIDALAWPPEAGQPERGLTVS